MSTCRHFCTWCHQSLLTGQEAVVCIDLRRGKLELLEGSPWQACMSRQQKCPMQVLSDVMLALSDVRVRSPAEWIIRSLAQYKI